MRLTKTARARLMITAAMAGAIGLAVSAAPQTDWPMWGGTPSRNMVSDMKGLPTTWDVKTGKNVSWVAELGSQAVRQSDGGGRRGHDRDQQ